MRKLIGVAVAVVGSAAAAPAASALPAARYAVRPMVLPAPIERAHAASAEAPGRWLIGARPGARSAALARRFGARALGLPGTFAVARDRARPLANALRGAGALVYAEPDGVLRRSSVLEATPNAWARGAVLPPTLPPPVPHLAVGIVDDFIDTTLPDLAAQTRVLNGPAPATAPHGTEVASAVSAATNGVGVIGVFPSVPLVSYGLPAEITCADAANGVLAVVRQKATVVNLSFGSATQCFTLFRAVEAAYGSGALVVAAGGNEFLQGNPASYPAAWPHVLSVAALNQALQPAFFSNSNVAIDVSAPGESVPLDVPLAFDGDGTRDGVVLDSGTSFAAPMVSGAAAWVWSARPDLTNGQVADLMRHSAIDIGAPGYDPQTGYGIVNVERALAARKPADDPLEPNDEITFIDGSSFRRADPYVWRGRGRFALRASVDQVEDPVDVYRVLVPARRRARVVLRTTFGDADLFAFGGRARTLRGKPFARSERGGRRTDAFTLSNRSRAPRRFYLAIASGGRRALNSSYVLTVRRG